MNRSKEAKKLRRDRANKINSDFFFRNRGWLRLEQKHIGETDTQILMHRYGMKEEDASKLVMSRLKH